jgi:Mg2+ and Co2+ transporter CorA
MANDPVDVERIIYDMINKMSELSDRISDLSQKIDSMISTMNQLIQIYNSSVQSERKMYRTIIKWLLMIITAAAIGPSIAIKTFG